MSEKFIKASELRIGNLVIDIETGKEYVIKPIDIYNASISSKPLFAGVELTKEKLAKAGFKYDGDEWSNYDEKSEIGDYSIVLEQLHDDIIFYSAGEGVKLSRNLEYVHHLQNLYLDLTGEELPIS